MLDQDPTRSLVAKAQKGDRSAFDALVAKHRSELESRVRAEIGGRLRSRLDVDDVLQETFLRAFETIDRFAYRGERSFLAWLGAIAGYLILNATQKRQLSQLQLDRDVVASGTSPSRAERQNERFDRLQAAVDALTPDQRNVVLMSRIQGLAIREIARRMERSDDAVRQLLSRALRRLQTSFGDTESLHLPNRKLFDRGCEDGPPTI